MSRLLVLLRHGKSDWDVPASDRDRPLTGRGRRQAGEAGAWLAGAGLTYDLAVVSPARRAADTWARAAAGGGLDVRTRVEESAYTFDGDDLLAIVRALTGSGATILVGHNPALEELVRDLTGDDVDMPTACLAVIRLADWGSAGDGRGELLAHGRPPGSID